jgi:hypothetical protein
LEMGTWELFAQAELKLWSFQSQPPNKPPDLGSFWLLLACFIFYFSFALPHTGAIFFFDLLMFLYSNAFLVVSM